MLHIGDTINEPFIFLFSAGILLSLILNIKKITITYKRNAAQCSKY